MTQVFTRFALLLAICIALLSTQNSLGQILPEGLDLDRIRRATVFIMQVSDLTSAPVIRCVSSGTLVSEDGLVISNAHSTTQNNECSGDTLVIALGLRPDAPPVPAYQAEILQVDAGLDLALLQINRGFDGRLLDRSTLSLPFVDLGSVEDLRLDETLTVVGYPGINDLPTAMVPASVQGFTAEPRGGNKAWIKVRSDDTIGAQGITGTMSGGGAYNRAGQLVGIPTTAPLSRSGGVGQCIAIQDSDGNALITPLDACVPIGGSINALRPADFAQPLLRSAALGLSVERPTTQDVTRQRFETQVRIGQPFFAPSITENMPTTVVSGSLPTGTDSLYFFFDYADMTPETVYELRVTINGSISPVFSLAPVRWSGGAQGLWYIGSQGQVWPNGDYTFTLLIDGTAVTEPRPLRIGGTPENTPTFSNVAFGLIEDGQMYSVSPVLGTGSALQAQFVYANMRSGLEWSGIWYFNGSEVQRFTDTWSAELGDRGAHSTGLSVDGGLLPGSYRLELYVERRLAVVSDFVIAGARDSALPLPRVFAADSLRLVTAISPQEAVGAPPITSVTNPIDTLYAVFDWEQIAPGTLWQMRWSVDGVPFYDQITPWTGAASGRSFVTRLSSSNGIPDGTYVMELLIRDVLLGQIEIEIGIGQLPLDLVAQAEGVQLNGLLLDANTRQGIPDATIFIISEDYSVADFILRGYQLHTTATSDRAGQFRLDVPLAFGAPYSVLITVDGYLPIAADGFTVTESSDNPLELTIFLTPD